MMLQIAILIFNITILLVLVFLLVKLHYMNREARRGIERMIEQRKQRNRFGEED